MVLLVLAIKEVGSKRESKMEAEDEVSSSFCSDLPTMSTEKLEGREKSSTLMCGGNSKIIKPTNFHSESDI